MACRQLLLLFMIGLAGCAPLRPTLVTPLPDDVRETSGLAWLDATGLWTINDSNHDPILFRLKLNGETTPVFIEGARNRDWEDLAYGDGNVYIGDFGNNLHTRRDQTIYIVPENLLTLNETVQLDSTRNIIRFRLPDQPVSFQKRNRNFDMEAMFFKDGVLYLVSKNAKPSGKSYGKLYRLPSTAGEYVAQLIDSFDFREPVTAADYDATSNRLVVTGYLSCFVFDGFSETEFRGASPRRFRYNRLRQVEGLTFGNSDNIFISNEKGLGKKAALWQFSTAQLQKTNHSVGVGYAWRRIKLSTVLWVYNKRISRLNG